MIKEQNGWLVFGCEKQLFPKQPRELTWDIVKDYEAESLAEARYMSKIWNHWTFSWACPRYRQYTEPDNPEGSKVDNNQNFFKMFRMANAEAALGKSDAELKYYMKMREEKMNAKAC